MAPNFNINDQEYAIPMVIEESFCCSCSLISCQIFGAKRGGFKAKVISTTKIGQVHFTYAGDKDELNNYFDANKGRF